MESAVLSRAVGAAAIPVVTPAATGTAFVAWLGDLRRTDVATVGGKGANLGELASLALPVPPAFVVTTAANRAFLAANALAPRIASIVRTARVDDPASLDAASAELRALINASPVPAAVTDAIRRAYATLGGAEPAPPVAVRSSATAEDAAATSFAGMFESYLDVVGDDALLEAVRRCWASAFGARILFYRLRNNLPHDDAVAVVVQRMVSADAAGVMFTSDPATGNPATIIIEAAPGLGEAIVQGSITPDHIVVDKATLAVTQSVIASPDGRAALPPDAVRRLAAMGVHIEAHYGAPQDIEFALAGDDLFLTQSRPISTLGSARPASGAEAAGVALVTGLAASPGQASGPVRVLHDPGEGASLAAGDVLVTRMTSPDWAPTMRRAVAIVTDAGGMTSHAAIVARELGVPCVVGTRDATSKLATGQVVTVDGSGGRVLSGAAPVTPERVAPPPAASRGTIVTATRLYVNLGDPGRADEIAALDVDGVGLLRAEFMILEALEHTHPRRFVAEHGADAFVDRMRTQLERFASAFAPRPVVYRAMDFRSNEFRGLAGGADVEPDEANPMIGYRGCFRYTREPDLFTLELRALAEVRQRFESLHLMIPFVRTKPELAACLAIVDASPLGRDPRLERWVMAEVPSVVHYLPEYVAMGITGVSIGSNDLTQLMLGVDRDSEVLAPLFDERDPAVLAAVEAIVKTARRLGITSSICGQAPSVHAEYVDRLVEWGIDSISVNPDVVDRARRNIAVAERRLELRRARE